MEHCLPTDIQYIHVRIQTVRDGYWGQSHNSSLFSYSSEVLTPIERNAKRYYASTSRTETLHFNQRSVYVCDLLGNIQWFRNSNPLVPHTKLKDPIHIALPWDLSAVGLVSFEVKQVTSRSRDDIFNEYNYQPQHRLVAWQTCFLLSVLWNCGCHIHQLWPQALVLPG